MSAEIKPCPWSRGSGERRAGDYGRARCMGARHNSQTTSRAAAKLLYIGARLVQRHSSSDGDMMLSPASPILSHGALAAPAHQLNKCVRLF
jgi:hypothetical protein